MSELEHSAGSSSEVPEFVRTDDTDSNVPERREREGLPPTYRMRADAHYVDQLDAHRDVPVVRLIPTRQIEAADLTPGDGAPAFARSIATHGILQPLLVRRNGQRYQLIAGRRRLGAALMAGLTEVPCVVHDVDPASAAVLAEADNLRAAPEQPAPDAGHGTRLHDILSVLKYDVADMAPVIDLLRRTDILQHRTFADVLYVQAWRAAWLANAAVIATQPYSAAPPAALRVIVERLRSALEREARLSRLHVEFSMTADAASALSDEHLETVLAAMIFIAADAQKHGDPARIEVLVEALPDAFIKLQIVQRAARVSQDAARCLRSGGALSTDDARLVAAAMAVRAYVAHHGGTVDVMPMGRLGSVVRMVAPISVIN